MLSAWCLLRGLNTILHLGPASTMQDRGKEFTTAAGLGAKIKSQTAADVGVSATAAAGVKSRESATATGRPAVGKM